LRKLPLLRHLLLKRQRLNKHSISNLDKKDSRSFEWESFFVLLALFL
jgi:hypothetical protein